MPWSISLFDQLPQLLVLSPLIGCLVTFAAARTGGEFIRQLAAANMFCTLLVLGGLVWRFEVDRAADAVARRPTAEDIAECGTFDVAQAMVHRRVDQQCALRLDRQVFAVDGINLWPTIVLVIVTACAIRQPTAIGIPSHWFIPAVLLFETASIAALTANDVQTYVLADGIAVIAMSVLLGLWGGLERRTIAERFLVIQFCGASIVMSGFAILLVAVPWMKIDDAPTPRAVTSSISTIIYEIQKWTTTNGTAYQYELESFPGMLLILSFGFAIQFGAFPFYASGLAVFCKSPPYIVALYIAGLLSISSVSWLRFVMPLAPDLLVGFDWLILIPSLGGAMWAAIRSLSPADARQKIAFVFYSFSGISLLGCFNFSRFGMSGAWLMQQQLAVVACWMLLVSETTLGVQNSLVPQPGVRCRFKSTPILPLLVGIPFFGLFASSYIIALETFRDWLSFLAAATFEENLFFFVFDLSINVFLFLTAVLTAVILSSTLYSLLSHLQWNDFAKAQKPNLHVVVLALAAIANLFPNVMLHQCEPTFALAFRRFERTLSASSAEPQSDQRQTSP
jgi:NADH:ubiquinone oxidoreductase subunit 4 (subunit M)